MLQDRRRRIGPILDDLDAVVRPPPLPLSIIEPWAQGTSALGACAGRPPRSEEWLWRRLSGSQTGFAFRRHLGSERHDAHRDRALHSLGWRVLRVTDHDVITNLDSVVARIIPRAHPLS